MLSSMVKVTVMDLGCQHRCVKQKGPWATEPLNDRRWFLSRHSCFCSLKDLACAKPIPALGHKWICRDVSSIHCVEKLGCPFSVARAKTSCSQ